MVMPASLVCESTLSLSGEKYRYQFHITTGNSKSLILRGSLSTFNAAYGKNYFELNWNTVAGDFDHFEIERSLDGQNI